MSVGVICVEAWRSKVRQFKKRSLNEGIASNHSLLYHYVRLTQFCLVMKSSISITVSEAGIDLNGKQLLFPFRSDVLIAILGATYVKHELEYGGVYTWNEQGINAHESGNTITCLAFSIQHNEKYTFTPKELFTGAISINAVPLDQLPITKKDAGDNFFSLIIGKNRLFISVDEHDTITHMEVDKHVTKVVSDAFMYQFTPIDGEKIVFKDFNFKLAVIQVLMYEKELITPAFDVHEFAARFKEREIDVDEEGYEIIPEVKAYFEGLEIDQQHAAAITEIYQDGGNDIYMNMIPFWSGETDDFNIQSFDDVVYFPHLRKITLFYDERLEEIKATLRIMGIEVDPL